QHLHLHSFPTRRSSDLASSGVQSGFIGNDEIQDPILDVGMKTSGLWTYSMDIYIDFGASGYFNAQHDLASLGTTGNWAYQCYIGDRKSTRLNSSHVKIS